MMGLFWIGVLIAALQVVTSFHIPRIPRNAAVTVAAKGKKYGFGERIEWPDRKVYSETQSNADISNNVRGPSSASDSVATIVADTSSPSLVNETSEESPSISVASSDGVIAEDASSDKGFIPVVQSSSILHTEAESNAFRDSDERQQSSVIEEVADQPSSMLSEAISASEPTVLSEVMLKAKILEERRQRQQRAQELSQLQIQLAQSMARKVAVENTIVDEIQNLRDRLAIELNSEKSRLSELEALYASFRDVLLTKRALLSSEETVLQQMREVRNKIQEAAIVLTLDAAIEKKASLIAIEESIVKDFEAQTQDLNLDIGDTKEKLRILLQAQIALPAANDITAARSYGWTEIEKLQQTLSSSIKASMVLDEKIESFVTIFDELMQRRGLVLGENTVLSADLAQSLQSSQFEGSTAVAVEAEMIGDTASASSGYFYSSTKTALMDPKLNFETNEDLSAVVLQAAQQTAVFALTASGSLLGAAQSFWKSEAKDTSQQSLASAVQHLQNASSLVSEGVAAVGDAWQSGLGNTTSIETTDEYMVRLARAVKNVFRSGTIRKKVFAATGQVKESVQDIATASKVTARQVQDNLATNASWNASVKNLAQSLGALAKVFTIGMQQFILPMMATRTLPPGPPTKL